MYRVIGGNHGDAFAPEPLLGWFDICLGRRLYYITTRTTFKRYFSVRQITRFATGRVAPPGCPDEALEPTDCDILANLKCKISVR